MDRLERPKRLDGDTYQKEVGCGTLYVTVTHNNGTPLEVFVTLGKSGGCSYCQNGALGRVISIGLQCGVPLEEFLHTLEDSRCPNPNWDNNIIHLSCPDAISKVFKDWVNAHKI